MPEIPAQDVGWMLSLCAAFEASLENPHRDDHFYIAVHDIKERCRQVLSDATKQPFVRRSIEEDSSGAGRESVARKELGTYVTTIKLRSRMDDLKSVLNNADYRNNSAIEQAVLQVHRMTKPLKRDAEAANLGKGEEANKKPK